MISVKPQKREPPVWILYDVLHFSLCLDKMIFRKTILVARQAHFTPSKLPGAMSRPGMRYRLQAKDVLEGMIGKGVRIDDYVAVSGELLPKTVFLQSSWLERKARSKSPAPAQPDKLNVVSLLARSNCITNLGLSSSICISTIYINQRLRLGNSIRHGR